jgi:hypothetical protein
MTLIDRIKNILLTPKTEWPVIAGETTPNIELVKGYVLPLAAIPAVAGFVGSSLIGHSVAFLGGTYRVPFMAGLGMAIFGFVMAIVSVYVMAYIVNALAPTFGAQKNATQAFKVVVFASTASWVGGIFQMIPGLSLLGLLASLYGIYILYLGLPQLMKCPDEKAIGYTAVVVVVVIVVSLIIGVIVGVAGGIGGAASGLFGGRSQHSSKVTFDKDSPLGKLDAFSKNMEAAGKKMEAAQKSGNPEEAMKAAMAGLGTAFSGGKAVDPIGIDQLKPFVPATFAGFAKSSSRAEKNGALGIMVSKAEASYSDGAKKRIDLEISDTGGASGWVALASWANVQGEQEDQYGTEKTMKVNGRLVHEKAGKDGRSEYTVVLGERFVVSAKGRGVELKTLKSAVSGLELGKLEALKDVGVQK